MTLMILGGVSTFTLLWLTMMSYMIEEELVILKQKLEDTFNKEDDDVVSTEVR